MSARKRRRGRGGPPESDASLSERWLVSYADMLTVLVGLFIVLYAISQVDQDKYEQLAASLAVGFGGTSQAVLHTGNSVLAQDAPVIPNVRPNLLSPTGPGNLAASGHDPDPEAQDTVIDPKDLELARREYTSLQALAHTLEEALLQEGLDGSVSYRVTERGLVVGLVSDELFFVADTAQLTPTSRQVIDVLAPSLKNLPNQIMVEGHANTLPSVRYPTNWELSADRATQVLRRFTEHGNLTPARIAAVGFGDSKPLADNNTGQGLAVNRRVDVVVLSAAPENIRELIPVVQQMLATQEDK